MKKAKKRASADLPDDVAEFFRDAGRRGGKRSLETMTKAERIARAKKAAKASAKARARKKKKRRS